MGKLKLSVIGDEKPVKVTIEISANLYRDLTDYAALLSAQAGQPIPDPKSLIAPMIERFIASDREFSRSRKTERVGTSQPA
ncbi:hypothetical protein SAMN06297144_2251 [Sphingomonas guangdongensis]|uniref:DUF2274 domain-containing protein n=1 Tax=Sphingomonas guangdongensis TaxID=1141890 RepID=A0A285QYU6_9SPHN|nr:DUF2274 domain-containing protein [Sphingomonas guangdongensis]SOB87130.1 hypothetical protein SAMN06297144_2251 [Sphingomonas guangdongensis]